MNKYEKVYQNLVIFEKKTHKTNAINFNRFQRNSVNTVKHASMG